MNLLSDVITYIRRIIKTPSNASISDDLLIDYINRFWIMDVDARIQLFDLKTKYSFQTTPGVDQYNMPLYDFQQSENGSPQGPISFYPVYQGFTGPAYINGVQVAFETQKNSFFNSFPNVTQYIGQVGIGDGTQGPYTFQIPFINVNSVPLNPPVSMLLRGHVDISGVITTGTNIDPPLSGGTLDLNIPVTSVNSAVYFTSIGADGKNVIVQDSGQFLNANNNCGLLMNPGNAPLGNSPLGDGISSNLYSPTLNTINYLTGQATIRFPVSIPSGAQIMAQCYYFQSGLPRSILYYNNVLTLRMPPAMAYRVELDAYLTPAAFLTLNDSLQFAYMSEYIARGAARKILSDTGDVEQFNFYEPLFLEQERLVWKRSQRQFTSTRTQTIYSQGLNEGRSGWNNLGASGI
jgi:hypothetical protein